MGDVANKDSHGGVRESIGTGLGWLERLLQLVERYGFMRVLSALVLLYLAVLVTYLCLNPERIVMVFERVKEEQHAEAVDRRFVADADMRSLMEEALFRLDADRVYLIELHNGSKNLSSGLPFVKGDMRIEVVRDSIMHVDSEYHDFSLSAFPFVPHIFSEGLFYGRVDCMQAIDSRLYYKFLSNDVSSVACIALYYGRHPLGVFGVSWCNGQEVDFSSKLGMLRGYSTKLSSILSDVRSGDLAGL